MTNKEIYDYIINNYQNVLEDVKTEEIKNSAMWTGGTKRITIEINGKNYTIKKAWYEPIDYYIDDTDDIIYLLGYENIKLSKTETTGKTKHELINYVKNKYYNEMETAVKNWIKNNHAETVEDNSEKYIYQYLDSLDYYNCEYEII